MNPSSSQTLLSSPGEMVRKLRTDQGLGMKELAELAGVSRTYLWQIETANTVPGYDVAGRIARALNKKSAGDVWPNFREDGEQIKTISIEDNSEHQPETNTGKGTSAVDNKTILHYVLEAWASVDQRRTRYAEISSPDIDYTVAREEVGRYTRQIVRQLRGADNVAECLLTAENCKDDENYEGAVEAYREARDIVTEPDVIALIDWHLGNAFRELSQYGDAIRYLELAHNWLGKDRIALEALAGMETTLGWLHYRAGNYMTARKYFEMAIGRWSGMPEDHPTRSSDESRLSAARGLASCLERQGNLSEATKQLSQILHESEKREDAMEIVWAKSRLGFTHIHTGNWDDAETTMREAMDLSESLTLPIANRRSLKVLQEIILNNQALLYLRRGDVDRARGLCEQSLQRAIELKDLRGKAFCHLFTAYVHVAREAWDEALAHALQAESQFRKMEILYYLPEVLSLQAVIFLKLTGTGRGALQSATEALELTRLPERSSSYQEAIVLRALGMAEGSLGEISSAQTHLDESIQLLSKAGEPYDLAWSHLVLADLLVNAEEDRFDVAGQHVTAAEEIAQQLSSQRLHHAIEEVRSRLSARIGQQS